MHFHDTIENVEWRKYYLVYSWMKARGINNFPKRIHMQIFDFSAYITTTLLSIPFIHKRQIISKWNIFSVEADNNDYRDDLVNEFFSLISK